MAIPITVPIPVPTGAAARDQALFMSVATPNANMSNGAMVGLLAISAVPTAIIQTGAIDPGRGLSPGAMAVSGTGERRMPIDTTRTPEPDMRSGRVDTTRILEPDMRSGRADTTRTLEPDMRNGRVDTTRTAESNMSNRRDRPRRSGVGTATKRFLGERPVGM
jgi:hypothetical protein